MCSDWIASRQEYESLAKHSFRSNPAKSPLTKNASHITRFLMKLFFLIKNTPSHSTANTRRERESESESERELALWPLPNRSVQIIKQSSTCRFRIATD